MESITMDLKPEVVKVIRQLEKDHGKEKVEEVIGASVILYASKHLKKGE